MSLTYRYFSTSPHKGTKSFPLCAGDSWAAIRLLESWMNDATPEEIEDQRETLALLQRARQEYPLSFRRVEFDDAEDEAQALQIAARPRHASDELVVATTNPKHLSPFVAAKEWHDIA